MNTKNNRRAQSTKEKIKKAFIELLNENSIEKISIKELCVRANVNRSTFYTYYFDIKDLLSNIIDEMNQQMLQSISFSNGELSIGKKEDLIHYLVFLKENLQLFKICFQNQKVNKFRNEMQRFLRRSAEYYLSQNRQFADRNMDYALDYYEAGLYSIIKKWVINDCVLPIEELENTIAFCMRMRN